MGKQYSEQELTRMLREAVEMEEYEKASKLRDAIRKKKSAIKLSNTIKL